MKPTTALALIACAALASKTSAVHIKVRVFRVEEPPTEEVIEQPPGFVQPDDSGACARHSDVLDSWFTEDGEEHSGCSRDTNGNAVAMLPVYVQGTGTKDIHWKMVNSDEEAVGCMPKWNYVDSNGAVIRSSDEDGLILESDYVDSDGAVTSSSDDDGLIPKSDGRYWCALPVLPTKFIERTEGISWERCGTCVDEDCRLCRFDPELTPGQFTVASNTGNSDRSRPGTS